MSGKGVNTADFLFGWKRVYQGGAKRLAFFFLASFSEHLV
jgi:hypothetical protein